MKRWLVSTWRCAALSAKLSLGLAMILVLVQITGGEE